MKTLLTMKTFNIETISNLSHAKVFRIFKEARWNDGKVYCIHCGSFNKRNVKNKNNEVVGFRCKDCNKNYSPTSDTIFNNHKYPLKTYLLAIFLFSNSAKGISSLQLARDLDIGNKTAYVILQKIRYSLFQQYEDLVHNKLRGVIQVDGAYINHKPKHPNKREDRIDRRTISTLNQQCILVLRELDSEGRSKRSYAFITRSENSVEVMDILNKYVEEDSCIITDEHVAYKPIKNSKFRYKSVNHSIEYQTKDGINTNQAESYFSRLRRMVIGQHHRLTKKYLDLYVNEITYRENRRFSDNIYLVDDLLRYALRCGNETIFNHYYQRNNSEIEHFKDYKPRENWNEKFKDSDNELLIDDGLDLEQVS